MEAKRYDDGKIDFTLLPVDALEAEALVWMAGQEKYGVNPDGSANWTTLWGTGTRIKVMKSLLRHCYKILRGEDLDAESGQHHAAHIRCNAAMLIRDYNNRQGAKK